MFGGQNVKKYTQKNSVNILELEHFAQDLN